MLSNRLYSRRNMLFLLRMTLVIFAFLTINLIRICIIDAPKYGEMATALHERERKIKAMRGNIISSDGTVLASSESVCTVSVVHSQLGDYEQTARILSDELNMDYDKVYKYVTKYSSMEKIASNVPKEVGDRIRQYRLSGVKVDEDYKRVYPFGILASKVLGFTGSDNQGILGLEVKYDNLLKGTDGLILTTTDAYGIELDSIGERRLAPENGDDLVISIDYNIQTYAQQLAYKAYEAKGAKRVSIIVMNPNDGRIYAMVDVPEYNLNEPYTFTSYYEGYDINSENRMNYLNRMWRNTCINDTYEPGSTFKMITATAALEEGVVSLNDSYFCSGAINIGGRTIHCANTRGHGSQSFKQTLMNSCNPAFIVWGSRLGSMNLYKYMEKLGITKKTGIDLPGEAAAITHKLEDVGEVELATMSFGQSFQITPLALIRAASAIINGGKLVTPHFAVNTLDSQGNVKDIFEYDVTLDVVTSKTSDIMKEMLESVVSEGGGNRCFIEGYRIGGKTATSQKLPRSDRKYIASFIGFAPADNPQVIAMCIIDEPQGIYYGGTIAAPVIRELFDNILPYLGIEKA